MPLRAQAIGRSPSRPRIIFTRLVRTSSIQSNFVMLAFWALNRIATCHRAACRPVVLTVASIFILASDAAYGAEPDYLTYESPVKDSVLKLRDIIGRGLAPAVGVVRRALFVLPDGLAPIWRDSSLNLRPRTYYFDRHKDTRTDSEAWATGGALEFRSGFSKCKCHIRRSTPLVSSVFQYTLRE